MNYKVILLVMAAGLTIGCSEKETSNTSSSSTGKFTATMADKKYDVAVNCSYFDTDNFTFRSDKTDATDSNGDGLIISGDQLSKTKLVLTVNDNGKNYSSPNIGNFNKKANGVNGSGKLFLEGSADAAEIKFNIDCG